MGQRTDHLAPFIVDGCNRMADHDAALIDDTDQAATGKAILQRPVHRRLIHLRFNLSDDIALVQVAVRVPVLGNHHGFPVFGQHINIGVSAFQVADIRQRMGRFQKDADIVIIQIRAGTDQIHQQFISCLRR